jgi:hypothetical protein
MNGMTSALGEYTPSEFWHLLDSYESLLAAYDAAKGRAEAAEREVARLSDMVSAYGRAEVGVEPERNELLLRFAVSEGVLRSAYSPMEVFAHSVSECMGQFREWMYTNVPRYRDGRRAQEVATALADAERIRSAVSDSRP